MTDGERGHENTPLPHFKIPSDRVHHVPHNPQARDKPLGIDRTRHGQALLAGLREVQARQQTSTGPLKAELAVFKVTLQDGQSFANRERTKLLSEHGLSLNAVSGPTVAIVSVRPERLRNLQSRVQAYTDIASHRDFQYVRSIDPIHAEDKETETIRRALAHQADDQAMDIQIVLLPRLTPSQYERVIEYIQWRVQHEQGRLVRDPYMLSDATTVVRAVVPPRAVDILAGEIGVYQIQPTRFFSSVDPEPAVGTLPALRLDPSVPLAALPIVAVFDSGIRFPPGGYRRLVVDSWVAPGVTANAPSPHGTQVASRVVFGDALVEAVNRPLVRPRARVLDVRILDGESVAEDELIERVRAAVEWIDGRASICNLSLNAPNPIDGDAISLLAAELDILQWKHPVQFVVSTGNQQLWRLHSDVWDVLDDDDSRIASPSESVLALTVGAMTRGRSEHSISGHGLPAPFTRRGPGFAGGQKPDLVAPGGDLWLPPGAAQAVVPAESGAAVIHPDGTIRVVAGTSFSAPVVAGDLAEVQAALPADVSEAMRLLVAKTLLIHTASEILNLDGANDEEEQLVLNAVGAGLSNPQRAIHSRRASATYVYWGWITRLVKQRVEWWVPNILAEQPGLRTMRIAMTCASLPPLDLTKGSEYTSAYVRATLHRLGTDNKLPSVTADQPSGRAKWQPYQHCSWYFSRFLPGMWQVWLQLFTRWETGDDLEVSAQ